MVVSDVQLKLSQMYIYQHVSLVHLPRTFHSQFHCADISVIAFCINFDYVLNSKGGNNGKVDGISTTVSMSLFFKD